VPSSHRGEPVTTRARASRDAAPVGVVASPSRRHRARDGSIAAREPRSRGSISIARVIRTEGPREGAFVEIRARSRVFYV
jgi:hypothetical protein